MVAPTFFVLGTTTGNYELRFGLSNRTCFAYSNVSFTISTTGTVTIELRLNATGTILAQASGTFTGTGSLSISTLVTSSVSTDRISVYVKSTTGNLSNIQGNAGLIDVGRPPS